MYISEPGNQIRTAEIKIDFCILRDIRKCILLNAVHVMRALDAIFEFDAHIFKCEK